MKRNKQIISGSIGAGVLVMIFVSSFAMADPLFDTTMKIDGGVSVDFTVQEDPWVNTGLNVSETNTSLTNQVNVLNNGDVPIDITAGCSNTADWTVGNNPGIDIFEFEVKETVAGSWCSMTTNTGGCLVKGNLAVDANIDATFRISTPTSTTHFAVQTTSMTFVISEHT